MLKSMLASAVVLAIAAGCGGSAAAPAASASSRPAPVTKFTNTLPGLTASSPFDLIQVVLEFAPTATTPKHVHPTPNLATVLEGAVTVKLPDSEKTAQAGQTIIEPLNVPCMALNAGTARALMVAAYPVAPGGQPSKPVAGEPAPALANKTLYRYVLQSPAVTGAYDLVQFETQFPAGAQTSRQKHGGPGIVTVIAGQLTVVADGVTRTYAAGESFTDTAEQIVQLSNTGSDAAVIAASYVVPAGAKLTTPVR